jgi:hypothetical protein
MILATMSRLMPRRFACTWPFVALLAVVTCVQARALQEPYGVEGREILYLRLMLASEAFALAEDPG